MRPVARRRDSAGSDLSHPLEFRRFAAEACEHCDRSMTAPDITACICTCDRYDLLHDALQSLEAQTLAASRYRVLVIDTNRSEHAQSLGERHPARRPVEQRMVGPVGLSAGRNRALEYCTSEFIAFLDDDARAEPGWLENLLGAFRRRPEAGVIGGPVAPIWETLPPSWLPESLHDFLSIIDWGESERDLGEGEWLCGTNLALRVADARACGRFRTDLGRRPGILLSNEELDLCQRLVRAGRRVIYTPGARVGHLITSERCNQGWLRRRVAWQGLSELLMHEPHRANSEWLIESLRTFLEEADAGDAGASGPLFREVSDAIEFQSQCYAIMKRVARMRPGLVTAGDVFLQAPAPGEG